RRTRPRGTFQDKTAMDRSLFAGFSHENKAQESTTPPSHITLDGTRGTNVANMRHVRSRRVSERGRDDTRRRVAGSSTMSVRAALRTS
ncbi:MAG: hypothetical protein OXC93_14155, partial [Rhodospirillaceae bacterium]|nr:hypothetical protein [Rhodospirillaceae bacterium]